MRCLRVAGERGGVPVGAGTALDDEIGKYLFSDAPTAVRARPSGASSTRARTPPDLRALEDLIAHLASVPDDAWAGLRKNRGRAPSRS